MPKEDKKVEKIPSDAPTALIAPSDYEHIYKGGKGAKTGGAKGEGVKRIPSDAPTALIAPPDYEHIYKGANRPLPKGAVKKIPSDAPTALIAPSDYEHIYKGQAKGKTTLPRKAQSEAPAAENAGGGTGRKEQLPKYVLDRVDSYVKSRPKKYNHN